MIEYLFIVDFFLEVRNLGVALRSRGSSSQVEHLVEFCGTFEFRLKMVEAARKDVLERLQTVSADQLEELCARSKLTVADQKKGIHKALFNIMVRYLTSEAIEDSADGGLDIFTKLLDELKVMLGEEGVIKKEDVGGFTSENGVTKIEVTRNKEFKITGNVGGKGDDTLDYMSLCYQMQDGKRQNFTSRQIMSGLIKANKAGDPLRRYLEGQPGLTEENFIKVLRSHYNVKDSGTLLNEMSNSYQEPCEMEMNFVLRMLDLRNKIITLSREEECPLEEKMVRKRFFHSLCVGLKRDTVRLELQTTLKNVDINELEDVDLLKEVSQVVARDTEHRSKMKPSRNIAVNSLDERSGEQGRQECDQKSSSEKTILAEISKLTAKVNELSSVKNEIKELKKQMSTNSVSKDDSKEKETGNRSNYGGGGKSRFVKCKPCEASGSFCTHCSICGAADHKRIKCPKNR